MLIDTHCHLVDEFMDPATVGDVIARAKSAGVGVIVIPGAEPTDAPKQIELIEKYDNVFATLGVHPEYANSIFSKQDKLPPCEDADGLLQVKINSPLAGCFVIPAKAGTARNEPVGGIGRDETMSRPPFGRDVISSLPAPSSSEGYPPPARKTAPPTPPQGGSLSCFEIGKSNSLPYEHYLSHPKVVGVGEIGLDYHYGAEHKAAQIELFELQLEIAMRAGLPVAIHSRDAEDDTASILTRPEFAALGRGGAPGVMHCYTSGWELARRMLDRSFFFSASGIITFKNSDNVREVFARVPLDRIVIETDAPFCAPIPHRGKPCEPFMVGEVARALSEIKNVEIGELQGILIENTKRLYPKIKEP